jgi:hypothetical protein
MRTKTQHLCRRGFFRITAASACAMLVQGCSRRKATKTDGGAPTTSSEEAADRLSPAFQPYIDVVVRPMVVPVKQVSDSTCWAAVWTMMLSWKQGKRLSTEEAVTYLGAEWVEHYSKNEGLAAQTFTEEGFVRASGLLAEPPANHPPSFYVERMASHGPLWINSGNGILNHATLLVSAQTRKDRRIDFRFADPQTGSYVSKSDEQFFHDFEREARAIVDRHLNWDLRFQVFYW